MSFGPPRKPPTGSRLPVIRKTSIHSVSSSVTTMPQSTASSTRAGSSCGGGPCGGGSRASSGYRGGAMARGAARPSVVETTSSTIIEPGRTTTTRTERRTGPVVSSGYGMQRPSTAPSSRAAATGAIPRTQPPRSVRSGYEPRRASGVCPGSSGASRASSSRGPIETVTSTSSVTIDPYGTETTVETEERVIQPASGRRAPVCPGAGRTSLPARAIPAPSGGRPSLPAGAGRSLTVRPTARTPSTSAGGAAMQSISSRSSKATFPDGRQISQRSSETRRTIPRSSGYGAIRKTSATASTTSVASSSVGTGTIPKTKTVTSRTSKSSVKSGKKTTTVQEITKTIPQDLPEGRYALSLKHPPHTKEGRLAKFSSPPELRHRMDKDMPKALKTSMMPPEYRGVQDIRKLKAFEPYKDVVSCAMDTSRARTPAPPGYYSEPQSFLETRITPERGAYSPTAASAESTVLEQEVAEALVQTAAQSPGKSVKISGTRMSPGRPHMIMTDEGPVQAVEQIITEKKVEKIPGAEKISRHITGIEQKGCGALQTELDTQQLEPGVGLPKRGDIKSETVTVRSSVAVSPTGLKETTTTVIYETTKTPSRSPPLNISPEEVERLVEEEAIDVNKTLKLKPIDLKVASPKSYIAKRREHELKLNYTSVLELEHSIINPEPSPDQETEDIQPEVVATIMHTEETKAGLESQPALMYQVLFPEVQDATMMTVDSVAPAPLQDVLVPHQLPEQFHAQGANTEVQAAITSVETTGETKPAGNAFVEAAGEKPIKNIARRGKRRKITEVPLLSEEMPPWGAEDMQPITDVVGAPLNTSLIAEAVPDEEEAKEAAPQPAEESFAIEYMLQLEPPTHISRIQLRGSTRPSWFQGYYVALPEIPDLVRVEKTAESGLVSAWRSVQPQHFPDESIITV